MSPLSAEQKYRHYQFRLVKRIDGARLVTHESLARATPRRARDKTFDIFDSLTRCPATRRPATYHAVAKAHGPDHRYECRGDRQTEHDVEDQAPQSTPGQPVMHVLPHESDSSGSH